MAGTKRPKASLLRLTVSFWLLATGLIPPSAAAQVALVAFRPQLPAVALPPLAELDALGGELKLHLAGRKPARLEIIAVRLEKLEARLAAGSPPVPEPDKVRAEIKRVRSLLQRALGWDRSAAAIAVLPSDARAMDASSLLRGALTAPSASARMFDGAATGGAFSAVGASP
ncbi:MAG: hypothetical protein COV48_14195, partial [Elusimicrobia bacterium CG11_big_fil_rev_8_21_14_0_20_64_6]